MSESRSGPTRPAMIASATSLTGAFVLALASPLPASVANEGPAAHKAGVTLAPPSIVSFKMVSDPV